MLLSLVACSSDKNLTGTDSTKDWKSEPVKLRFYTDTGMPEAEFKERIYDKVVAKFPNITPEYQTANANKGTKLEDLIAAGETVDIIWNPDLDHVKSLNMQFDITQLIKEHNIDMNSFIPEVVKDAKAQSDGKLYGVPGSFLGSMILIYNKDIFDKFGLKYSRDGMDWEETLDLARKASRTVEDKNYVGLITMPNQYLKLNPLSVPILDPKTEKPTFATNELWKRIIDAAYVQPGQIDQYKAEVKKIKNGLLARPAFVENRNVAMMIFMSHYPITAPPEVLDSMGWDMVAVPTFKEAPKVGTQVQINFWTLTSVSKHKEAAMEVIKYLSSEEYWTGEAKKGAITPLVSEKIKKLTGTESKYKDKNWGALYYNKIAPSSAHTPYDNDVRNILNKHIVSLARDWKVDTNTAIREAQEEAEKFIAAQKAAEGSKK
jgi:multiple sugar transport system substrate-binding protein